MHVEKQMIGLGKVIPVIAAMPYRIVADQGDDSAAPNYDSLTQRTLNAGRDYSTSREDESAGGLFSSKSDTKKDD